MEVAAIGAGSVALLAWSLLDSTSNQQSKKIVLIPPQFDLCVNDDHLTKTPLHNYSYQRHILYNRFFNNNQKFRFHLSMQPEQAYVFDNKGQNYQSTNFNADISLPDKSNSNVIGGTSVRFKSPSSYTNIKLNTNNKGSLLIKNSILLPIFNNNSQINIFSKLPLVDRDKLLGYKGKMGIRYDDSDKSAGIYINPFINSLPVSSISYTSQTTINDNNTSSSLLNQPSYIGTWISGSINNIKGAIEADIPFSMPELYKSNLRAGVFFTPLTSSSSGAASYEVGGMINNMDSLIFSYYHNFVVRRRIHNPFSPSNIVGINNYINLGLELQMNINNKPVNDGIYIEEPHPQIIVGLNEQNKILPGNTNKTNNTPMDSELRAAASWQINRNVLVKGRISSSSASLMCAFKSWWTPSAVLSIAGHHDFNTLSQKVSFGVDLDNIGAALFADTNPNYKRQIDSMEKNVEPELKFNKNY